MTTTTLQPQTDSTTIAAPRHRLTGRLARRLAPLGAAIAIIAAVAGGTASNADAAIYSDNSWATVYANCETYQYARSITIHLDSDGPNQYVRTQWSVNGVWYPMSGWVLMRKGMNQATTPISGPAATYSLWVEYYHQLSNGVWEYGGRGYATMTPSYFGTSFQSAESCKV
jgi:hypothetical protein